MMKLVFTADHSQHLLEQGVKGVGSAPEADMVLRGEGNRVVERALEREAGGVERSPPRRPPLRYPVHTVHHAARPA